MDLDTIKYLANLINNDHKIAFYIALIGIALQTMTLKLLQIYNPNKKAMRRHRNVSEVVGYITNLTIVIYLYYTVYKDNQTLIRLIALVCLSNILINTLVKKYNTDKSSNT